MARPLYPALLLALIPPSIALAQSEQQPGPADSPKISAYANAGLGLGSPHAVRAAANLVFAGRHQLSIGYSGMTRKSPGVPAGATKSESLGSFGFDYPQKRFSGLVLGYGYVFYPNSGRQHSRFVMRASLLLGTRSDLSNVRVSTLPGNRSYSYERESFRSAGLLLEPGIELIASKGSGVSFSPYAVITDHMAGGGISINLLFGYVSNYNPLRAGPKSERHDFRRSHPFRRYPSRMR